MSDGQVIEKAAAHLQNAARFPPGSERRATEWARFWAAFDEFGRRGDVRVLRRLGQYPSPEGARSWAST
jgi:hypothetical protein